MCSSLKSMQKPYNNFFMKYLLYNQARIVHIYCQSYLQLNVNIIAIL